MATLYYTKSDPKNPELNVGVFVKSNVPSKEIKKEVKRLNDNLTDDEKSVYTEYDYLNKDYTEDEFYEL